MLNWLRQLDELLRGDRTRDDLLRHGTIDLRLRRFVPLAIALGAIYGFFMAWYALFGMREGAFQQAAATMIKLPMLFLLTLGVTFPSLYVFNALVGCKLSFAATMRLLVGAIVINLAVAASLGPILGFFTVSTTSYPFMVLLNVVLLGIGGMIGLSFLLKTLRALAETERRRRVEEGLLATDQDDRKAESPGRHESPVPPPIFSEHSSYRVPSPSDPPTGQTRPPFSPVPPQHSRRPLRDPGLESANFIFRIWVIIYALVGAQMGWVLRPFIGSPDIPFTFFRERSGHFFAAVWNSARALMGL